MARRLRLRSSAHAAAAAAALAALAALAARFAAAEGVPFEEQARDALKWALDVRADAVREFALEIEASYDSFRRSGSQTSGCSAPSACAAALPPEAVCDAEYGATEGCECAGRRVDHTKGVIKIPGEDYVNELTKPGAKHAVCFMDGLETTVQRIRDAESDASLKVRSRLPPLPPCSRRAHAAPDAHTAADERRLCPLPLINPINPHTTPPTPHHTHTLLTPDDVYWHHCGRLLAAPRYPVAA